VNLRLDAHGHGAAAVQEKYVGASNTDRHYFYRQQSREQLQKTFEDRVAGYANGTTLQRASYSGTENSCEQIVENFSFVGNFATASAGDSWFFQPLFLSGYSVPEISPQPRVAPVELGTPYSVKGEYRIELPADLRLAGVPPPTSLQTEFGALAVTYQVTDNILLATETLSFTSSRIPPEKFEAFRGFLNATLRVGQVRLRTVKAATP
jgi:hypothetical protein